MASSRIGRAAAEIHLAHQAVMRDAAAAPDQGQRPGQGAGRDLRLQKARDARQPVFAKILHAWLIGPLYLPAMNDQAPKTGGRI